MIDRSKRRAPLYSRSTRPGGTPAGSADDAPAGPAVAAPLAATPPEQPAAAASSPGTPSRPRVTATTAAAAGAAPTLPRASGWRRWLQSLPAWSWAIAGALAVAIPVAAVLAPQASGPRITQEVIDKAVLHTLQTQPLPAPAAKAFDAVSGSLVRVVGRHAATPETPASPKKPASKAKKPEPAPAQPHAEGDADDEESNSSVGSGVVIVDTGIILTNLHVVAGSQQIKVVFHEGTESEATVVNVMPEHDLAVLRAHRIPDDLKAATMRSTADLRPGDRVTAVGFPFGIGPTVSHGVVSGLKREFRSPQGQRLLTNLIQFDAMANPGSSGGPLVTDDGEVVGIVTAIYNPVQQRFFVGIGFAVPIESAAAGAGLPPF